MDSIVSLRKKLGHRRTGPPARNDTRLTARLKVFLVFPFRLSLNYPFGISEAVGPGHPKKKAQTRCPQMPFLHRKNRLPGTLTKFTF